jgi:hypothetical protein
VLSKDEERILKKYAKAIVHMRTQLADSRFGLVIGAGVNKPYGLPNWTDLVRRIAADHRVRGSRILSALKGRGSLSSQTQVLFQHFKSRRYARTSPKKHHTVEFDRKLGSDWRTIIGENLYRGARLGDDLLPKHPYMSEFIPVIRRTDMTVNYNFDDVLERMLMQTRTEDDRLEMRGAVTIWSPRQQYGTRSHVIYHPNGYLPQNPLEGHSDELVFADDAFGDQLLDTMAGRHSNLSHHLFGHTCLFLGLSLDDTTLKHLLRQSARLHPGHYHYYVAFSGQDRRLSADRREAIRAANFDTYNLITLFLTSGEIRALGRMLNLSPTDFRHEAEEHGVRVKYCYYLVGSICVGKTTCLSHFGSLQTVDEWFDRKPSVLAKQSNSLSQPETERADTWVARQFSLKNRALAERKDGIFVIDRCPLDPIAFTPPDSCAEKACFLQENFRKLKREGDPYPPQEGHVFFLTGANDELAARTSDFGKTANPGYIQEMQAALANIYQGPGVTPLNTQGRSVDEVVHILSSVIHLQDYVPMDVNARLAHIAKDGLPVANA